MSTISALPAATPAFLLPRSPPCERFPHRAVNTHEPAEKRPPRAFALSGGHHIINENAFEKEQEINDEEVDDFAATVAREGPGARVKIEDIFDGALS